jgi:hypothetical protein
MQKKHYALAAAIAEEAARVEEAAAAARAQEEEAAARAEEEAAARARAEEAAAAARARAEEEECVKHVTSETRDRKAATNLLALPRVKQD